MNPIDLISNDDGTYTLEYFRRVIGYINKSNLDGTNSPIFRAVSTLGGISYAATLDDAKKSLLEMAR